MWSMRDGANEGVLELIWSGWRGHRAKKVANRWLRGPRRGYHRSLWYPGERGFLCSPPQEPWLTNSPSSSSSSPSTSLWTCYCYCKLPGEWHLREWSWGNCDSQKTWRSVQTVGRRWVIMAELTCRQSTYMHESTCAARSYKHECIYMCIHLS